MLNLNYIFKNFLLWKLNMKYYILNAWAEHREKALHYAASGYQTIANPFQTYL